MKPGDIVFYHNATDFYIVVEELKLKKNVLYKKFKCFSSDDSTLYVGTIMPHLLNYISEGIWEYRL